MKTYIAKFVYKNKVMVEKLSATFIDDALTQVLEKYPNAKIIDIRREDYENII